MFELIAPEFHLVAEHIFSDPFCELTYGLGELAVFEQVTEHTCTEADDTCTTTERIHGVRVCVDGLLTLGFEPVSDSLTELRTDDGSLLSVQLSRPADDLGFLRFGVGREDGNLGERGVGQLSKADTGCETVFEVFEEPLHAVRSSR